MGNIFNDGKVQTISVTGGFTVAEITGDQMVNIITIAYLLICIVIALPKLIATVKEFRK